MVTQTSQDDWTPTDVAFGTVFSFLILVNLVGNTLVCLIILKNPVLRTSINILIVNLAASDMLLALSILPQHVLKYAFVHPNGTTGDNLCRFVTGGSFAWLGDKSGVFTVVLIALERFKGIHSPFSTRANISNRTIRKLIVACWVLALVLNAPLFYATRFNGASARFAEYHCKERWDGHLTIGKVYAVINFLAIGAVPFLAIVYFYARVVYALWSTTVHLSSSAASEAVTQESRKYAAKMLIAVSLLFGILRFPNIALYLWSQFHPKKYDFGKVSYKVSVVLMVLNSSIDPFMYSLHSTRFRKHVRRMFRLRSASFLSEQTPLLP